MTESLVARALTFATAAHAAVGHRRKFTFEPYIVHPIAVAEIVKSVPHDEAMLAAALLHDVIEDSAVTRDLIDEVFGPDVADLVWWLTDYGASTGNRAERKAADRKRLAGAPARAQTIKLADLIHNTASIVEHDPEFARVYMREKELLLDVLLLGDPTLRRRALDQMADYTGIIH